MLFIVIVLGWLIYTTLGGFFVLTSKRIWSPARIPLRERFDTQAIIGWAMLLSGVAAVMLFLLPYLI